MPDSPPPSYCHNCGKSYPWTDAKLRAAIELLEISPASASEKEELKADLPAIITDGPRSPVATAKWKQFLIGAGKEVASAFRDIFVDVASETAKKTLFGP